MSRLIVDGNGVLMSIIKMSNHVDDAITHNFLSTFLKIIDIVKPDEIIVAWDKGPSWRKNIDPNYKENRKVHEPSESQQQYYNDLNEARNWLKTNLHHFGVSQMWYENGEADDIAGWLTTAYIDKPNVLYSKDKDWLMLIDNNTSLVYKNTKRGVYITVTLENFEEETSWKTPEEFLLAKCAIGDMGDNVPGIKGIGPQTVRKYLEGRASKAATLTLDEFYSGSELLKHNLKMMDIRACVIEQPLFKKAGCYSEERVLGLLAEKGFVNLAKRSESWLPNLRNLSADLSNPA